MWPCAREQTYKIVFTLQYYCPITFCSTQNLTPSRHSLTTQKRSFPSKWKFQSMPRDFLSVELIGSSQGWLLWLHSLDAKRFSIGRVDWMLTRLVAMTTFTRCQTCSSLPLRWLVSQTTSRTTCKAEGPGD